MQNNIETEYAVGTLRVSSTKQGLQGESHEQQKEQIERRAEQLSAILGKKVIIKKWFKLTESASGDLEMQPVNEAIEYCTDPENKIRYFFFKSIDRMTRGGSVIYGFLKQQLSKVGVQCVDVYGIIGFSDVNTLSHLDIKYPWSVFSPTWTTELLEAERSKGEVRDILTRMIGAEIDYVRLGYRVRGAPPGFKNVKVETPHKIRVILAPHDIEAPWFIRMFELRAQGNLEDDVITEEVNKLGYESRITKVHDPKDPTRIIGQKGGKPLTVKQLQRYIQNPIYAGINCEKWTNGKPVKERFEGLVSIEMFNKANKGKVTIIEDGNEVKIIRGKVPLWQLKRQKNNPDYAYKNQIMCPQCGKPLLGSASRSKSGKHVPRYHCARGHKYWSINKIIFDQTISSFVKKVDFTEKFRSDFRKVVLREWQKRKDRVQNDSISSEKKVLELKQEQQLLTDKLKLLSSPVAIRSLEKEIDDIEARITDAIQIRDRQEDKVFNIQILINYCEHFMEHLDDLILGGTNSLQNATIFGLFFDKPPTYNDLVNGTPNLSPIFGLKGAPVVSKKQTVTPQRVELCLTP